MALGAQSVGYRFSTVRGPSYQVMLMTSFSAKCGPWTEFFGAWKKVPGPYSTFSSVHFPLRMTTDSEV